MAGWRAGGRSIPVPSLLRQCECVSICGCLYLLSVSLTLVVIHTYANANASPPHTHTTTSPFLPPFPHTGKWPCYLQRAFLPPASVHYGSLPFSRPELWSYFAVRGRKITRSGHTLRPGCCVNRSPFMMFCECWMRKENVVILKYIFFF